MPELPEVETIRKGLEKYLIGKKIISIDILDPNLSHTPEFQLTAGIINAVRRLGKGLVIDLNNKYSIAIHVKMTGQLIFQSQKTNKEIALPNKHTRAIFNLDNHSRLFFNDVRKFGWVKILKTSGIPNLAFFRNLGPEPLKNLTPDYLYEISGKSNLPVKTLIMAQNKISGIGNIYANDALNLAKINPLRKAKTLSKNETRKLYLSILEVLSRGLKYGGSSEVDYVNADGKKGSYQNHSLVYNRKGEKCYNCGKSIKKIKITGRGTYFCVNCQK